MLFPIARIDSCMCRQTFFRNMEIGANTGVFVNAHWCLHCAFLCKKLDKSKGYVIQYNE
jgi:hypothetical protein